MMFGDADPEDGFDAGDPADEQITVLERLADAVERDGIDARSAARLGWANHVADRLARRRDVDTERVRAVAGRLHRLAETL